MDLTSPAYIFGAIVFGLIGLAAFRLGRKSARGLTLWLGIAPSLSFIAPIEPVRWLPRRCGGVRNAVRSWPRWCRKSAPL